jgi:hypothetical protein
MFLDTLLSPAHCQLLPESFPLGEDGTHEEEAPQFETLTESNTFSIRLRDSEGNPHYISSQKIEEIRARYPVTVILNNSDKRLSTQVQGFNFNDIVRVAAGDSMVYQAGCLKCGGPAENALKFKVGTLGPDPGDHSQLVIKVDPSLDGTYWLHVFLGNEELEQSPIAIRIVKSDE